MGHPAPRILGRLSERSGRIQQGKMTQLGPQVTHASAGTPLAQVHFPVHLKLCTRMIPYTHVHVHTRTHTHTHTHTQSWRAW